MKDVSGKIGFITGGASGLGFAMAKTFLASGMRVALTDIEDAAIERTKAFFSDRDEDVLVMKTDVTDRDSMAAAREQTLEKFGKVHVVCNNAGIALNKNAADMNYKDWDWVLGVNLEGVVNGVTTFVGDIKSQGEGGHFVNTASIAGHHGMLGLSGYCASKFGVVGMSEAMRIDLAEDNIGISVLCPGPVATGIFNSERVRPDKYGGTEQAAYPIKEGARQSLEMETLEPDLVGQMVLNAVLENRFYIMTHSEFQEWFKTRTDEIQDEYDYWKNFREKNG